MPLFSIEIHHCNSSGATERFQLEAADRWEAHSLAIAQAFGAGYGWQPDSGLGAEYGVLTRWIPSANAYSVESGRLRISCDAI